MIGLLKSSIGRWFGASASAAVGAPQGGLRGLAETSARAATRARHLVNDFRRGRQRLGKIMLGPVVGGLPDKPHFASEPGHLLPSNSELRAYAEGLDSNARRRRYPCLAKFARDIGLSEETLIATYELEDRFHDLILAEPAIDVRRRLNDEVYTKAFAHYGSTFSIDLDATESPKDALVSVLRPELEGKSILDVGCGAGDFLLSCARSIRHGALLGLDVFAKDMQIAEKTLEFKRSDVVRFDVAQPFDVAITDNVYEHIAPQDIDDHLSSIARALKPGGTAIILTPHRAFGPWDVTRIVDNSYCGWVPARGTHINESTYTELSERMRAHGFVNLRTIHPKVRLGIKSQPARVPVDRFCRGEQRPLLMRSLQNLDKRFRYVAFEISLIGTKA